MLTKPEIKDATIITCLKESYGLEVKSLSFLPLGADFNTAVYGVEAAQGSYFLKLRRGNFLKASVRVPKYLGDQGVKKIIPPLPTKSGDLWVTFESFKGILYPYVTGKNGVEHPLSDQQWRDLGACTKQLHTTHFTQVITEDVPQETFSFKWCEQVRDKLLTLEEKAFEDPVALEMKEFLQSKGDIILEMIQRTEALGQKVQNQNLPFVLCHADLHGWNSLIEGEDLYVVDWDTLIFAPKERDLMFIGAGIHETGRTQEEEESLFYQGYGEGEVNKDAILYYRYARIIEDIGEYCEQIFSSLEGGEDRAQSFEYLKANFSPGGTVERARGGDD